MNKLRIDPEFHALCGEQTADEKNRLRELLKKDGCRDAIVTWANHDDTIMDGHTRYEICEEEGLPYKAVALAFETRSEVLDWIADNQLGRRNLTAAKRAYLIGRKYNKAKKGKGKPPKKMGQNGPLSTADEISKETGVSSRAVKRAGEFHKAVAADPEIEKAVLDGKLTKKQAESEIAAKLARHTAPANGKQKSDPRAFASLKDYFGAGLRKLDALHKLVPADEFHQKAIEAGKQVIAALEDWQKAIRKAA
jgi:hypothetical protein